MEELSVLSSRPCSVNLLSNCLTKETPQEGYTPVSVSIFYENNYCKYQSDEIKCKQ